MVKKSKDLPIRVIDKKSGLENEKRAREIRRNNELHEIIDRVGMKVSGQRGQAEQQDIKGVSAERNRVLRAGWKSSNIKKSRRGKGRK